MREESLRLPGLLINTELLHAISKLNQEEMAYYKIVFRVSEEKT